ncbi:ABC transporter substrate-binding protein [Streptomyces sp. AJS327]|uniref:ABC transporter substrate-binding protein n=1 Tax=Streptomyces sp. AJS327 TaxID=2545265 RepID=UPI0015DE18D4|nr:ABC transporter substrate-binding protein [Streptomyces sp. AJS327]MBA0053399.1 ABC transporter substrate-binding protein [Streptomyces sp. AJS327]
MSANPPRRAHGGSPSTSTTPPPHRATPPSTAQRATGRRRFLGLLSLSALAVSCGTVGGRDGVPPDTLRYQGWAGTVTPPELAADLGYLDGVSLRWVGNTTSGPQDIQSAASGQVDFGGAFNGAVVKMAAAKAPVTAVVSYYGVDEKRYHGLYVRRNGPLRDGRDLIGKRVAMNTLGAHAEAVLDTYLRKEGLSDDEAQRVERVALPPVNLEQALRAGQIDVAVLGDILRDQALERGGVRALVNDHELLGSFSAGTYVVANRFLDRHPDVVRAFVTGVARAIEWSRERPHEEVVDRMLRIVRRRDRGEDTTPLRYWQSYGVAGSGGRIAARELSTWAEWLDDRDEIARERVDIPRAYSNAYNRYRGPARATPVPDHTGGARAARPPHTTGRHTANSRGAEPR